MKEFIKSTLATVTGLMIFGAISFFIMLAAIGTAAVLGNKQPGMPQEGILKIDMSSIILSEQSSEVDPIAMIQGGGNIAPLGIYNAVKAINAAADDPAIKFIYMKPDDATGGLAQIEELRTALHNFRASGKAIVSYMENPTNAGYYLASVSDKIFMTPHNGGLSMFNGLSSQMVFLKDILDRLGVNVQLIRHGKYKSAGEMYIRNSSSKENLEQNVEMVESIWKCWAAQIASSRGLSMDKLNEILDDLKLNSPADWVNEGLVDELLDRNSLEQRLCDIYVAKKVSDIKSISLNDYAKIKNVPNILAKNKVAVIFAEGNIVDGSEKNEVAGDRFAKIISEIRQDSTIKAVVLRVNSPGGSVLASEKIKNELDLLRQTRPVIASYGDYAASGGYWISANCDKIYSNATTLTGSIGVFSMIPDFSETLKNKLHVNVTSVNSNSHSDMYSGMRALTKKEVDYMQASVEDIYDKFTTIVAEGRNMTKDDVDNIAQGRVWSGNDAIQIGLVDEIGTLEDAINYAALTIGVTDAEIVEYPKPQTTFDILLESFGGTENVFAGTPFEGIGNAFSSWTAAESGKVYARMPYEISIR